MWALARFCAPWVPNAGEKGKNASSRERKAFGMWRFGTRSRQPARAFFSFSPGNCLRCKKRAKAHTPWRAAIRGFLIDVRPPEEWNKFKERAGTIADVYRRFLRRGALDTRRCHLDKADQVAANPDIAARPLAVGARSEGRRVGKNEHAARGSADGSWWR